MTFVSSILTKCKNVNSYNAAKKIIAVNVFLGIRDYTLTMYACLQCMYAHTTEQSYLYTTELHSTD